MLTETAVRFPGTTWHWLTDGEGSIVDPFDLQIWVSKVPGASLAERLAGPLDRTGQAYRIGKRTKRAITEIHDARLAAAVAALPHNDRLLEDDAGVIAGFKNDLDNVDADNVIEATMSMDEPTVPRALTGADAVVGVLGANTCVGVVARGANAGRSVQGGIHLNSDDMRTLATATAALTSLHAAMGEIRCDCWAAGGNINKDPEIIMEYARVVAAFQLWQGGGLRLAGAVLPATERGRSGTDLVISAQHTYYLASGLEQGGDSSSTSDDDDDVSGTGDDGGDGAPSSDGADDEDDEDD